MNRTSSPGYSARYIAIAAMLLTIPALWSLPVAAHGGSTIEEDSCVRWIQSSRVHFNAYRPDLDPKSHYCDEIPELGPTLVVIDLVDQSLRTSPTEVSIYRLEDRAKGDVLKNLSAQVYPSGVIETSVDFATAGRYLAEISSSVDPEMIASFLIRVGDQGFQFGAAIRFIVMFLLLAFIAFRLYKWWLAKSQPIVS